MLWRLLRRWEVWQPLHFSVALAANNGYSKCLTLDALSFAVIVGEYSAFMCW